MTQLRARLIVDILLRQAAVSGGFAAVIHRGDDDRGIILVQTAERGVIGTLLENIVEIDGLRRWRAIDGASEDDEIARAAYVERRRRADPDLWLIELDIADAAQLVAQWTGQT